eukprot:CAMPEP_0185729584 /NCGR_PEP_ID=MMETSP1171-20130828/6437_1 /TAXON_ID=374046 /ORGANISM="Helicotheca tamensis, Strain CCMP826" /LENGTH=384 /DNA_ID=CAMNT_0028398459 /DNA_START=102 /DNA_END=1256 /DNA_ORIENTATION=-
MSIKKKKLRKKAKHALYGLTLAFLLAELLLDVPSMGSRFLKGTMSREALHASDGHMTISRKNKLLYVHVPKTGGTTMEHSSLFDDARDYHPLGGHHPVSEMLGNAYERKLTHFVKTAHIRHPCDRFLSAFNYLQKSGNDGDKAFAQKYNIDTQTIDEFISNFNTHTTTNDEQTEEEVEPWDPYEIKHFIPQVEYVFYTHDGTNANRERARDKPDGTFGLDVLMCTEQWEEGFTRLEAALGGGGDVIPQEVKTARENSLEHMTCADLTEESRATLERVYAMDYCVFDYPPLPLPPPSTEEGGEDAAPVSSCVGEYTTPEMFTSKYKQCLMEHKPEQAAKKPEAVWPVTYLARLSRIANPEGERDDDSYGADDDELAAYLEEGLPP